MDVISDNRFPLLLSSLSFFFGFIFCVLSGSYLTEWFLSILNYAISEVSPLKEEYILYEVLVSACRAAGWCPFYRAI